MRQFVRRFLFLQQQRLTMSSPKRVRTGGAARPHTKESPLADSELPPKHEPALLYTKLSSFRKARRGKLKLPHFTCDTPMFMPVGTQGSVKGLTPAQLETLDCHTILGNTYHLALRPGEDLVDEFGGLHSLIKWNRNMLTDSGGFQMVSLLDLAEITEQGVTFQSPVDGSPMLLTPERSIQIQNKLGADIMMALDDVVASTTPSRERVEEAMHRTIRWIDRCMSAHSRQDRQNLFAIVQGGLDAELRATCLRELIRRDLPGYAVGGLSGGEEKSKFWKVVDQCTSALPENKPRYLMGVGYPLDLVVCVALGIDMFDCVYPTRTGRFGIALVPEGTLSVKAKHCKEDMRPIDPECSCFVCQNHSRAHLHALFKVDSAASVLISYHNIAYLMRLMKSMRDALDKGEFPSFVQGFMSRQFPAGDYPDWSVNALKAAGIDLL